MFTEEEMRTTIAEVNVQINSHPLTYCSSDTSDPLPLTPAEIIIGRPLQTMILKTEDIMSSSRQYLLLHGGTLKSRQVLSTMDTSICDSIDSLREVGTIYEIKSRGRVVLVSEDRLPIQRWKL